MYCILKIYMIHIVGLMLLSYFGVAGEVVSLLVSSTCVAYSLDQVPPLSSTSSNQEDMEYLYNRGFNECTCIHVYM